MRVIPLRERWTGSRLYEWLTSDLRRAVAGGPDEPPLVWTARRRRIARIAVGFVAALVAWAAASAAFARGELTLEILWPLGAAPLAIVMYRPLLAWRVGWALGLLGLLFAPPEGGQFHWSPALIWVGFAVLFVLGTTQPLGVLVWVWLATLPLAVPAVDLGARPVALIVIAGVLLGGYQVQRRRSERHQPAGATLFSDSARELAALLSDTAHEWREGELVRGLRDVVLGGPDPPPALGRTARRRRLTRIGLGVATFLLALLAVDTAAFGDGWAQGARQAVWTLSVVPLALTAYRPLLAWRIAWLVALLAVLFVEGAPEASPVEWFQGQVLVFMVVLLVVGTSQRWEVLVWIWVATVGLAWAGTDQGAAWVGVMFLITGLLAWGYLLQRRAQSQSRLAEAQELGTVLTERARIARELHDVVAHHLSMITVRTETAPYRLADLPEHARTEFAEISQASREALAEMRRLLGVLRSDQPELATAPQPGLADLPELVESTRAAGAEVTLDVDDSIPELPAAVGVSAYRIVQEALTNASRHAAGAPIRVAVRQTDGGLSLSVQNDPGADAPASAGPGHGIRGMRERAAMLGGELRAGPALGGGFEVSTVLPLRGSDD